MHTLIFGNEYVHSTQICCISAILLQITGMAQSAFLYFPFYLDSSQEVLIQWHSTGSISG
jgi:hypothetical protein